MKKWMILAAMALALLSPGTWAADDNGPVFESVRSGRSVWSTNDSNDRLQSVEDDAFHQGLGAAYVDAEGRCKAQRCKFCAIIDKFGDSEKTCGDHHEMIASSLVWVVVQGIGCPVGAKSDDF